MDFAPLAERSHELELVEKSDRIAFLSQLRPRPNNGHRVLVGEPAARITQLAETDDTHLIVLGQHEKAGLRRFMGSTTKAVLNHCEADVLAIHPTRDAVQHRKVLVALDLEQEPEHVLQLASAYVHPDATLELLTCLQRPAPVYAAAAGGADASMLNGGFADRMQEARVSLQLACRRVWCCQYQSRRGFAGT